MKAEGKFDAQSQEIALKKARDITFSHLSEDAKEYIKKNFGDINEWVNTQIEASINLLKNI